MCKGIENSWTEIKPLLSCIHDSCMYYSTRHKRIRCEDCEEISEEYSVLKFDLASSTLLQGKYILNIQSTENSTNMHLASS